MTIQIKLKNSVVQDSTPSTSDLPAVGELALNANINSIGGFMRASDNTIVKIFGPGSVTTPTATTTVSGIAELATSAETTTGSATNRVVTPAGLNAVTVAERSTSNSTYLALAGGTLTGVVAATAGSNSAPSIHFGDSDSGIFGGTNTVSLTAGGTTRLTADTGVSVVGTLAVTGPITSTSNLTIADKIIHAGDTDTAIGFLANTVSVETGGSEAVRVDSSQRLLVGTSSSRSIGGNTQKIFQIEGTDAQSGIAITRNSATNTASLLSFGKSRGTSNGTSTIVQDNDQLGRINFSGADGTDLVSEAAKIEAFVDGTPGANDMPGRLVFSTTADGADASTTRLTIDSAGLATFTGQITSNGNITIQNTGSAISLVDTDNDSDFQIKNNNGTLFFRDTTNSTNRITIDSAGVVDVTNNLNANAGLDVTGAFTSNGTFASAIDDNTTDAFTLKQGSNEYITVDTDNSSELITLGNTTTNPKTLVLGNGLLVGTTTEGNTSADDLTIAGSGDSGITIRSGTSSEGSIMFSDATSGTAEYAGWINYNHNSNFLRFFTNSTEKLRIDQDGKTLLGHTSKLSIGGAISQLQVHGTTLANGSVSITRYNNGSGGSMLSLGHSRGTSAGTFTSINNNDVIGAVRFAAADGTDADSYVAQITAEVDGSPGSNDTPGRITFETTADGAASSTERMRLNSAGQLQIGGTTVINSDPLLTLGQASSSKGTQFHLVNDGTADLKQIFISANKISRHIGIDASEDNFFIGTDNSTSHFVIDSSGKVGIGTNPARKLHVGSSFIRVDDGYGLDTSGSTEKVILDAGFIAFNADAAERVRITTHGLTFNGDTASANALDDYEEGTWTFGLTAGGGSQSLTSVSRYTKIGRMVHINFATNVSTSQVGNTGTMTVDTNNFSLPFAPITTTRVAYSFPHRTQNWTGDVDGKGLTFELLNSTMRLGITGSSTNFNNPITQNAVLNSGNITSIPMSLSMIYYTAA